MCRTDNEMDSVIADWKLDDLKELYAWKLWIIFLFCVYF
jgi:hypothetical protein